MKFIAYHRIFDSQGLALDSQRESVSGFVAQEGGELVGEYSESVTDVAEVGEQFEAAIQHCSRIKAVLVLAESDPLSRQLRMLARLVGQHVPLAAAGLSNVNAVLQPLFTETAFGTGHARPEPTAGKTKRKSKASPKRIGPGNPNLSEARVNSAKTLKRKADEFALQHCAAVLRMRANGKTLAEIADLLNNVEKLGPRRGDWWPQSVSNLIARCECLPAELYRDPMN